MTFAIAIKTLREERGLSQAQLAKSLKITRAAVGNYESGESTPPLKKFVEIVRFFGVSADYLLGLVPPVSPPEPPALQNQTQAYTSDRFADATQATMAQEPQLPYHQAGRTQSISRLQAKTDALLELVQDLSEQLQQLRAGSA